VREAGPEVSAQPGEAVGRLKLTVPEIAVPYVVTPVLGAFRARHPRVEVEVVVENRLVDIVAEGYDAGVRLHEAIERDMVQVRLTDAFRFVVVGAPSSVSSCGMRYQEAYRRVCLVTACAGSSTRHSR